MKLKKTNKKDLSFILGVGSTAIGCGSALGLGILSFQNMRSVCPIGNPVEENNTVPGTAYVYFYTEESVKLLVKRLKEVGAKMANHRRATKNTPKKIGTTVDAPKHSSLIHIDERRKIPRKRAKR